MKALSKYIIVTCFCAGAFLAAGPVLAQTSSFIPSCLLGAPKAGSECDSVVVFIWLAINVGKYLFSFIGALALLFFVYGGVILIMSRGNKENISKGTKAMMAAATGLIIAFSGYALITFLGQTVGVKPQYQLAPYQVQQNQ